MVFWIIFSVKNVVLDTEKHGLAVNPAGWASEGFALGGHVKILSRQN